MNFLSSLPVRCCGLVLAGALAVSSAEADQRDPRLPALFEQLRSTGEPLEAELIDDYLYRFDRVVESGVVLVRTAPQGVQELYFRRRRELEGP